MTYAHREDIYDADTHMMEHPDWIRDFADKDIKNHLEPIVEGDKEVLERIDRAIENFNLRQHDPLKLNQAKDEFMGWKHKGWEGLGAFNAEERKLANDLLGFKAHIVFPTSAFDQVLAAKEDRIKIGGIKALNKGMTEFCSVDKRMHGAAYIPFAFGEEIALSFLKQAIQDHATVIMIDTIAPTGSKAFTHPDFDPVWKFIEENNLAVTLHVGADNGWDPVPLSFYNNGGQVPPHKEGDAPRDALAYMGISYNAELFLASLIFDGIFTKFPDLRIGVVELGASWIISWMKHLDQSYRAFRRLQDLSHVELLPSEYVMKHIKITPFPGEDIGWLLNNGCSELLMFASDYPHHEGTDDPIDRFEKTMADVSEDKKKNFYSDNFKKLLAGSI